MFLIEPCCTQKQLPALRDKLGKNGTMFLHGYGDLSVADLLPVLLTRYSKTDMVFVCPVMPNSVSNLLMKWMEKTWASADGKGEVDVISHLTVITNLNEKKSPNASKWKEDNPMPERISMFDCQQNDTAIILPDFAIYGNINLTYGGHFTALATTNASVIANLRNTYMELTKNKK